ncbi:uncharacterized protein BP01DRAFT_356528 [Aspergillus saccharolyticus JOP 1030-1]|uniref:Uncharacterized protein n=1 Tax=Aspergillus saccharolyticus JOP 1030-1 TaxID=1450539 RepID=A0A319AFA0_9EURO|nr:hypothetical protein BP01DRAFT_356528 [Aspergillus saccharolyticus JOP 1030-1]PYH45482.1 hypothetical protein BP01DRAFT_356528 [Aspergillus saccharolyticus JOP 1030-1]
MIKKGKENPKRRTWFQETQDSKKSQELRRLLRAGKGVPREAGERDYLVFWYVWLPQTSGSDLLVDVNGMEKFSVAMQGVSEWSVGIVISYSPLMAPNVRLTRIGSTSLSRKRKESTPSTQYMIKQIKERSLRTRGEEQEREECWTKAKKG